MNLLVPIFTCKNQWIDALRHCLVTLHILLAVCASAQTLRGRVTDVRTHEPLAFVAIAEEGTGNGCYSDIDGYYELKFGDEQSVIVFSYTGYHTLTRKFDNAKDGVLNVEMHRMLGVMAEVVILPGVNPAERIIRNAINNKKKNDPENDVAFTYDSYNKLVFGAKLDSVLLNNPDSLSTRDTSTQKLYDFFSNQYLMLMESVAKRKYMPPNHSEETIIANRVSGLKNTEFFLLATQLQSFSFYGETVDILGTTYMSPLADGAIKKYLFILEDTTLIETDTVFTISFRPRKGKNFTGMKGQLFINTNGYAIQNVIAEPNEPEGLNILIQQQYEHVQGMIWFPVQLNSFFTFPNMMLNGVPVTGEGRSYIKNLQLNAPLERREFSPVTLLMAKGAGNAPDSLWSKYREHPLEAKETNTYQMLDSIGEAENLDRKLDVLQSLSTGLLPLGPVSIELARLLRFNRFEGYRIGAGLRTNDKVSKRFNTGGYYAYGFKDKRSKYGGDVLLHIYKKRSAWLRMLYENDVMETGGNQFTIPETNPLYQGLYPFFVNRMDRREKTEVQLNGRVLGNLSATGFANVQVVHAFQGYLYTMATNEQVLVRTSTFRLSEAGISIRFAPGEKLVRTSAKEMRLGGYYPVFYVKLTKGFDNILNGAFNYLRLDLMMEKTFRILNVGDLNIMAVAGRMPGEAPLSLQYNARGTNTIEYPKQWLGVATPGAFETMRTNEFMHAEFAAVHIRHNFKSLLYKGKKFRPQLLLVHNMLWGKMKNPELHNTPTKGATNGYYESGIQLNNLLRTGFTGFGIGFFYRYGPESLPTFSQNLAVKITTSVLFN